MRGQRESGPEEYGAHLLLRTAGQLADRKVRDSHETDKQTGRLDSLEVLSVTKGPENHATENNGMSSKM